MTEATRVFRSTPTHVGNTRPERTAEGTGAVHPHARGEYVRVYKSKFNEVGPPPRTWGILYAVRSTGFGRRSTPTHVGNTYPISSRAAKKSVHPHARGEYWGLRHGGRRDVGPPPRTWGIPCLRHTSGISNRSTPTHVGNTIVVAGGSSKITVHPHARGEYWTWTFSAIRWPGPPPRTWGILTATSFRFRLLRSTPTHVGNTSRRCYKWMDYSVHPHARGEYALPTPSMALPIGPPPRTWGILDSIALARTGKRSTPTHVGNTSRLIRAASKPAVHPHARGEYGACGWSRKS